MDKLLWTQISDIGPAVRFQQAMSYDIDRDRVVLFSGRIPTRDGEQFGTDTWEFDGSAWMQVEDTGPTPRCEFSMCYDTRRKRRFFRRPRLGGLAARHLGSAPGS